MVTGSVLSATACHFGLRFTSIHVTEIEILIFLAKIAKSGRVIGRKFQWVQTGHLGLQGRSTLRP
jgi:hypothetical protein